MIAKSDMTIPKFKTRWCVLVFQVVIVFVTVFFFRNSFQLGFFGDDFAHLASGSAESLGDFINFFATGKESFYRPLPTEVFYFVIKLLGSNPLVGHLISFITYFVGLQLLYFTVHEISGKRLVAGLTTLLYGLHFSHVFQLYWLATFQEVALFTFIIAAFYGYLKRSYLITVCFFALALLSKEQALLFPVFIFLYQFLIELLAKKSFKPSFTTYLGARFVSLIKKPVVLSMIIMSAVAFLAYSSSLDSVTSIAEYQITWSPKLIINNGLWYLLWALGLPSNMPLYLDSIFSLPNSQFYSLLADSQFAAYFYGLLLFLIFLVLSSLWFFYSSKNKIKFVLGLVVMIMMFYLFIVQSLLISHRWMVRLTIPLIFVSFSQALVLSWLLTKNNFSKYFGSVLIFLYLTFNYYGVLVHERFSLYFFENQIINKATDFVLANKSDIDSYGGVYFLDLESNPVSGLNDSKKLFNSFSDQKFLQIILDNPNLYSYYQFKHDSPRTPVYRVSSKDLIP